MMGSYMIMADRSLSMFVMRRVTGSTDLGEYRLVDTQEGVATSLSLVPNPTHQEA